MRTPRMYLAIGYLVVAVAELTLHAYMSYGTSNVASAIQAIYVRKDPLNGRADTAGIVDLTLPAVILGLLVGAVDVRATRGTMWRHVAILAGGVLLLVPLYAIMARGYSYPLPHIMGKGGVVPILSVFRNYLFLLLLTGVFAYFSRLFVMRRFGLSSPVG